MLLDEMNLARVEHCFSDWLACTESRRDRGDGAIMQHPVPLHRSPNEMKARLVAPDGSMTEETVPPSLELPTNLVVTGTVNVDETTYGFSPKVLDRAMVIEFDTVDLDELRSPSGPPASSGPVYRFPEALPPFRLARAEDYAALPSGTHEQSIMGTYYRIVLVSRGRHHSSDRAQDGAMPDRTVRVRPHSAPSCRLPSPTWPVLPKGSVPSRRSRIRRPFLRCRQRASGSLLISCPTVRP